MIINTVKSIAASFMYTFCAETDKNLPEHTGSRIKVNPEAGEYMSMSGEGGWINAMFSAIKKLNSATSGEEKNFYTGKLYTMCYFYKYELPAIKNLSSRLKEMDGLTLKTIPQYFED